jgi:hypothetical protein
MLELYKLPTDNTTFKIDYSLELSDREVISAINSVTVDKPTLTIVSYTLNSITVADGLDQTEYTLTANISTSFSRTLNIPIIVLVDKSPYYGSIISAETYFGNRLNSDYWTNAVTSDKRKALVSATLAIDRLNFVGKKVNDKQKLEFPREPDVQVFDYPWGIAPEPDKRTPEDIKQATYEIALKFLSGVDPDMEAENAGIGHEGYSGVRLNRETNWVAEWILAGIPSQKAWNLLKSYLVDVRYVKTGRVN